jgi:hypothetical protein
VTALLNRKGDTLQCHLINKNREESGFRPQTGIQVRIVIPPGLELSDATAAFTSPDLSGGEFIRLPVTYQNGALEVTVPELRVYGVLVIPESE